MKTLTKKIIVSREHLTDVQAEFQSLQFYLLKFSIPGFENQFDKNFEAVDKHKSNIVKAMSLIKDSSLADIFNEHTKNLIKYLTNILD